MFTISVETQFKASHQLTLPDGSKEPIHLHHWQVTAEVAAETLNPMGLVMDFHKLKAIIKMVLAKLDNSRVNDLDDFRQNNPSAENIAEYIYRQTRLMLPKSATLISIRVGEEPGCFATYTKG